MGFNGNMKEIYEFPLQGSGLSPCLFREKEVVEVFLGLILI